MLIPRSSLARLLIVMAFFVGLRLPVMFRQEGGEDEEFYAVPGYTVATEGIPRVPYVPARDRDAWFYRVDDALFALPPAYFYWQGPFFLSLPAGYATARLASAAAGLMAVWLVYELGRRLLRDEAVGLAAAALYSLSRVFFFSAIRARPDILCGMLGLAALLLTWSWRSSGNLRPLMLAGACLGLGMLTHPFALAYCLQIGGWVVVAANSRKQRLAAPIVLTGCALATFALWTPLILSWPELFREQFVKNVLDQAGPGLTRRILLPWPSLVYHYHLLLEHVRLLQLATMSLGLIAATWLAIVRRDAGARLLVGLAWSGVYLLVTVQGAHPAKGYWCYPGALIWLSTAYAAITLARIIAARARLPRLYIARATMTPLPVPKWWLGAEPRRCPGCSPPGHRLGSAPATANASLCITCRICPALAGGILLAAMLPGLGARAWLAHVRHWNDVNYNAPRFARELLRDLPSDARLAVDEAFVFDAYLAGRRVVLACNNPRYFESNALPYDYLILTRLGRQKKIAASMHGRLLREYGDPHDLFACYAGVYVPVAKAR